MRAGRVFGSLLLAAALVVGISVSASAAAAPKWTRAKLPGLCAKHATPVVQGSAAISAREAWLVVDCQGTDDRSVVLHEVGGRWTKVPHPASVSNWGQPEALAASGPQNVWVFTSTGIWRYDGAAWRLVPSSGLPAGYFGPNSFDVDWFVSTHPVLVQSATRAVILGVGRGRPVVATWNGTRWSTTNLPTRSKADRTNGANTRVSISRLPGTSRYIVAYGADTAVGSGAHWRLLPKIAGWCKRGCESQTVVATGKKRAYLVGQDGGGTSTKYATWNGSKWKLAALPKLKARYGITDLAAVSRTSLEAVGYISSGSLSTHTVALHFNGKKWKVQASPTPGASKAKSVSFERVSAVWGRPGFLVSGDSFNTRTTKTLEFAYRLR